MGRFLSFGARRISLGLIRMVSARSSAATSVARHAAETANTLVERSSLYPTSLLTKLSRDREEPLSARAVGLLKVWTRYSLCLLVRETHF